jgi:hypothetical protein
VILDLPVKDTLVPLVMPAIYQVPQVILDPRVKVLLVQLVKVLLDPQVTLGLLVILVQLAKVLLDPQVKVLLDPLATLGPPVNQVPQDPLVTPTVLLVPLVQLVIMVLVYPQVVLLDRYLLRIA